MNLLPGQSVELLRSDYGGGNEKSYITPSAMGGSFEVQDVLAPSTAGATQGDYFVLTKPNGVSVAGWLDINAAGVAPVGAAYVAATTKVKCSIVTGGTAAQNGTIIAAAFAASPQGWAPTDLLNGHVSFTQTFKGDAAAPARHNAADAGNGSFTVATTTAGTAPTVQGQYFLYSNTTTTFYGWFTNAGNGVDPAPGGATSKVIALAGDESNAAYLAAITAVIDTSSGMTAELDGSRIGVHVDAVGPATNLTAGTTAFSVEVASEGGNRLYGPDLNLANDNPQPSAIT